MRLVAFSGLLLCSLAATLRGEINDDDRFLETAKKLIQAINREDSSAIQASFDAQMQRVFPPDKATPFFRAVVAARGKLMEAGAPQVTGPTAMVRVTAERGAWDFKITLNPSGKIAGLLITDAAAAAPRPGCACCARVRVCGCVRVRVCFRPALHQGGQQTHSGDQSQRFGGHPGKLRRSDAAGLSARQGHALFPRTGDRQGQAEGSRRPQVTGPTAIVRVTAERGAWDFKITLDASDKISGLSVTPPGSGPAAGSTAVRRSRTPMQLPFRGEWYVFGGGDNEKVNNHASVRGQQRAADLIINGTDGRSYKGYRSPQRRLFRLREGNPGRRTRHRRHRDRRRPR